MSFFYSSTERGTATTFISHSGHKGGQCACETDPDVVTMRFEDFLGAKVLDERLKTWTSFMIRSAGRLKPATVMWRPGRSKTLTHVLQVLAYWHHNDILTAEDVQEIIQDMMHNPTLLDSIPNLFPPIPAKEAGCGRGILWEKDRIAAWAGPSLEPEPPP